MRDAVVQAAAPSLPELDVVGHHAIAAPVRRALGLFPVFGGERVPARLQPRAALDRVALWRGPRAGARADRPRVVVRARFVGAHLLGAALAAHLALELLPEERERHLGVRCDVAALAALVVGEEDEAARIDAF